MKQIILLLIIFLGVTCQAQNIQLERLIIDVNETINIDKDGTNYTWTMNQPIKIEIQDIYEEVEEGQPLDLSKFCTIHFEDGSARNWIMDYHTKPSEDNGIVYRPEFKGDPYLVVYKTFIYVIYPKLTMKMKIVNTKRTYEKRKIQNMKYR